MKKTKLKAAVLFTGGKDSCLALLKARKKYHVKFLLTVMPKNPDSFMFHKPELELLGKQADMLGINLVVMGSEGKKNKELEDLKKLLKLVRSEVDVVIAGAIKSNYQGKRIRKICSDLGLDVFFPLWNYKEGEIWKELLKNKFKVIISKIASEGLPREFVGKVIGKGEFEELRRLSEKYKFGLSGEGGDFETSVLYMPGFKKEIKLDYEIKSEDEYRHLIKLIQIK